MTFLEQKAYVQKQIGDKESATEAIIETTLNAVYRRFTESNPDKVLKKTGSFNTVASQLDQQTQTDVGRLLRAWDQSGENGDNGKGTIQVRHKDWLVNMYPRFHIATGFPRVIAPNGYDDDGYFIVNCDRLPDDVYAISFDYRLRVTLLTADAQEMVVEEDDQQEIAIRTVLNLVPNQSEVFENMSRLLGMSLGDLQETNQDGPAGQSEWKQDDVTTERRELYYSRYARG